MDLLLEACVGLVAGLVGGLLGLGGSVIIIPGMIVYLSYVGGYSRSTQHLLQAAAMVCNVFIAAPSVIPHWRAKAIIWPVLRVLMPSSLVGMVLGVAASNCSLFARQNGPYLAMLLAAFFIFVAVYNVVRALGHRDLTAEFDEHRHYPIWKTALCGLPMGFVAGLLGIGGGTICVPAQQIFLRIPLRRAIANSAVTIVVAATIGAAMKNATLARHGESVAESLRLAATIIPTAIVGGYLGGRLTHVLSRKTLRAIFIVFMLLLAYITFDKARRAIDTPGDTTVRATYPSAGAGSIKAARRSNSLECHWLRLSATGSASALETPIPALAEPVARRDTR